MNFLQIHFTECDQGLGKTCNQNMAKDSDREWGGVLSSNRLKVILHFKYSYKNSD